MIRLNILGPLSSEHCCDVWVDGRKGKLGLNVSMLALQVTRKCLRYAEREWFLWYLPHFLPDFFLLADFLLFAPELLLLPLLGRLQVLLQPWYTQLVILIRSWSNFKFDGSGKTKWLVSSGPQDPGKRYYGFYLDFFSSSIWNPEFFLTFRIRHNIKHIDRCLFYVKLSYFLLDIHRNTKSYSPVLVKLFFLILLIL